MSIIVKLSANHSQYTGGAKPAEASSTSSSWFSYGTAMVANIVENIQLDIRDIHIRYEGSPVVSLLFLCSSGPLVCRPVACRRYPDNHNKFLTRACWSVRGLVRNRFFPSTKGATATASYISYFILFSLVAQTTPVILLKSLSPSV